MQKRSAVSSEAKEAVSWLLLAYSLGHSDSCACEHCPSARKAALSAGKIDAA